MVGVAVVVDGVSGAGVGGVAVAGGGVGAGVDGVATAGGVAGGACAKAMGELAAIAAAISNDAPKRGKPAQFIRISPSPD